MAPIRAEAEGPPIRPVLEIDRALGLHEEKRSPPGMKTISPPGLALDLGPPPRLTLRAMLMQLCRLRARFCRGEDRFPVVLHVYHGPAFCRTLVERLVELAHVGSAVIGIFPRRVGVMHEAHEAEALGDCRTF